MNRNNDQSFKTSQKFLDIKDCFEMLFIRKGYKLHQKFGKNVWFLKDDTQFQSMIQPTYVSTLSSTASDNIMYIIFRQLSGEEDFRKLSIEVGPFLEKLCEILLKSNELLQRAKKNIEDYDANKSCGCLPETIDLLNQMTKDNVQKVSSMEANISKLENFAVGKYDFQFMYSDLNPNDPTTERMNARGLKNQGLVYVHQGNEVLSFQQENNETNFATVNFCGLSSGIKNEMTDNDTYSGSTLATFWIRIHKDGQYFGKTKHAYFFHTFLNILPELRNLTKNTIRNSIDFEILKEESAFSFLENNEQLIITIDMIFEFDPITRAEILSRMLEVLRKVIQTKCDSENVINEILDKYFKEISEKVKQILDRRQEEISDHCDCEACLIQ